MFVLSHLALSVLPTRDVAEYLIDTMLIPHNTSVVTDGWVLQRWMDSSDITLTIAFPWFIQNLSDIIIFQSKYRKICLHVLCTLRRMETRKSCFDFCMKYPLFWRSLSSWMSWIVARNIWIVCWKNLSKWANTVLIFVIVKAHEHINETLYLLTAVINLVHKENLCPKHKLRDNFKQ
jgi:hypothetical protein